MPRRYHRPPAAKRRKTRRTGPAGPYEENAGPNGGAPAEAPADEFEGEEWEEDAELDVEPSTVASAVAAEEERETPRHLRHIQRDYGYVRGELQRIAIVAAVLIVALVITAILR